MIGVATRSLLEAGQFELASSIARLPNPRCALLDQLLACVLETRPELGHRLARDADLLLGRVVLHTYGAESPLGGIGSAALPVGLVAQSTRPRALIAQLLTQPPRLFEVRG